jgi:hypothetical protein
MKTLTALTLCFAFTISACGGGYYVGRGMECYHQGHYQAAADEFRGVEPYADHLNAKGMVRYYVFRGLTYYKLGQRTEARAYLERGSEAYSHGDPAWLHANAVEEMKAALADLKGSAASVSAVSAAGAQ